MSKKNEKRSAFEKELERRMLKFRNPFNNAESIEKYCDRIKEEVQGDGENCAFIDFKVGEQCLPSGVHQLSKAVVMMNGMHADPVWIQSGDGIIPDTEAYIGTIDDPVTEMPQTRAFWRCKIEETGEEHRIELESFYVVALAKYTLTHQNDEAPGATINYGLITGFANKSMFEMDFYEASSINIIKDFISDISDRLNANPENKCMYMPKKELFTELMSKLTSEISKSMAAGNKGDNMDSPNRKKYNRKLKMVAVKLVIENNQPISEVEKKLGIGSGNLNQWLLQYEKYGEKAFQGSGSVSPLPDKRALIKELFKNEIAAAAAVPDTAPTIDADKYSALNLTPEKEKKLAACSYKLKKYDKEFKVLTVKRIKENELPTPQVAEILGINVSDLNRWVCAYDKLGENAFPGGGYKPHNIQKADSPTQNDALKRPVYDKKFKTAAVKYVNENNLSAYQAAKELNISYDRLYKWIIADKKYGENAFPGPGVHRDTTG